MNGPFLVDNARERARLGVLVNRLTDGQLDLPMKNGWTIAATLAHLAFWDQRCLSLMRKWKVTGVSPSPIDVDVTNEALLPFWLALPSRVAARLALSSAEAIDRELEAAPSTLLAAIEELGERFRLHRWEHRKRHLDAIEESLSESERGHP
jgi:hypothetical protein